MSDPVIPPCAKCGHDRLYVIDPWKIPDYEYSSKAEILPVHTHGSSRAGHFQARVCRQCGFTELYARDAELLARMHGAGGVTAVTATPGTYR